MKVLVNGLLVTLALCSSVQITAARELCPASEFKYTPGDAFAFDPDAPIEATANNVTTKDGVVTLDGETVINYQNRRLLAENALYNRNTGIVEIAGDLVYESDGVHLRSSDATFDIENNTFSTGDSSYEMDLGNRRANGEAAGMARVDTGEFRLENATYSACPPGDKSWFIRAESIELDRNEGIGTANKITLNFKGVPLLAVPTFSFPISPKRKTGFLAPVLGSNDSTGFELEVPWYWNIRPNLDATITPRFMTQKGTQIQGELRYLSKIGIWTLDSEYLYDGDLPRDQRDRNFTRLRHNGNIRQNWTTELDIGAVSDKNYFEDLGDSLSVASITHLERRADLIYEDTFYRFLTRLQSYQTVDEAIATDERPYQRLPQLLLNADWPQMRFGGKFDLDAELVYFDRTSSVRGSRLDVQPRFSYPLNRDAWFFTPTVTARYTFYDLNNVEADNPDSLDRALTTASIDTGLFFDRATDEIGSVQTLEPRLFYLRVPYRDQGDIPNFDSSELDFNISQLFRENRFSGADRVADANQLSVAVTTRFIEGVSGREELGASIGQIFYFDDRRVGLEGDEIQTSSASDLVAELSAELDNDWVVRSNIQFNADERDTFRSSALISYQPDRDHIINLAHRNVDTDSSAETEQLDFSFLWPVSDNWRLTGRWNFSLDGNTSIETLLGVEYESCCWAFRLATRRYISEDGEDHENSYYFQLVLKGLAPVGDNIGELLGAGIFGYRDKY